MSTLIFGPIDYRLGRQVFILESRVRFPVGLQYLTKIYYDTGSYLWVRGDDQERLINLEIRSNG